MTVLIIGLILFFTIHLVPLFPLREKLINKLGENRYKGIFTLLSLAGLILIVVGYRDADTTSFWFPVNYGRELALYLMPISFVLLAASNMKSNIKRIVRHPMLLGIIIWSFVHLLNNGELRAILLFGAFIIYAFIDLLFTKKIARVSEMPVYPVKKDIVNIIAGVFVYAAVLHFHHYIAGVAIIDF